MRVLLIEDDEDTRDTLVDVLIMMGASVCVCAGSVVELKARSVEALACRLAILDVNLGSERSNGLDACAWLQQQGFAGRLVFLTGHARSHPLVAQAYRMQNVDVLMKPVELEQLRQLLEESSP